MNNLDIIYNSLADVQHYIEKKHFKGHDPYDTLGAWFPFHWFGKWGQAVAIQAGKLIPFNFRLLFGIKKEENPKGLGLILQAYCILYETRQDINYLERAKYLFKKLIELRSEGYTHYCWGYNFIWANPQKVLRKYHPSAVVTSFVGQGIFKYYSLTNDKEAFEILKSIAQFILEALPRVETSEGIYFCYTSEDKDCCYNASMLCAEFLAMVYSITGDDQYKEYALLAARLVVHHQHEDGHWNYSINLTNGIERQQIDFHQGFVLMSLYTVAKYTTIDDKEIELSIRKGLKYYREAQFYDNGQSLWRIPKAYPVDIHNQSQGIITFSQLSLYNKEYLQFANTIAKWTIKNMQSNKGYFYYRKFKYYTNKVSYMRWSQAWILLALSRLVTTKNGNDIDKDSEYRE